MPFVKQRISNCEYLTVCVNDDTAAHLGRQLEEHVSQHLSGVVRLIRTEHREGLIRARIYGADHATGDVSNRARLLCKGKRCQTPRRSLGGQTFPAITAAVGTCFLSC